MTWSVHVDFDFCQSNAMCMSVAPEVFDVDDEVLEVLLSTPPDAMRGKVEEAILLYPTTAISIKES